jgi:hypothetical protein
VMLLGRARDVPGLANRDEKTKACEIEVVHGASEV